MVYGLLKRMNLVMLREVDTFPAGLEFAAMAPLFRVVATDQD